MAGPIRISILANASQAKRELSSTATAAQNVSSRVGKIAKVSASAGSILRGALVTGAVFRGIDLLSSKFREANEAVALQEKLAAQTNAVLKSTGGVAGVTAKDVTSLADAVERKSMLDAEAVQAGQNLLLTFTNIRNEAGRGNDIFTQTTSIMADMATALGTEPKQAALQLGKALNDPVRGVSALSRVGVSFTEKQKGTIATLVKSGKTMAAQKIILGELRKEFGGSAKAAGETAAGQFKHFKDMVDAGFEAIVRVALPALLKIATYLTANLPNALAAAQPYIDKFVGVWRDQVAPVLTTVFNFLRNNKPTVLAFASVLGVAAVALGVISVATGIFNAVLAANPISIVVLALAALAAGLVYAYTHSDRFRAVVQAMGAALKWVARVVGVVIGFIRDHWRLIISIVGGPLGVAVALITKHWNAVKRTVSAAVSFVVNFVKSHWALLLTLIAGPVGAAVALVIKNWSKVKAATSAAWDFIKNVIINRIAGFMKAVLSIHARVMAAFVGAASWLINAGKQIIGGLLDGIESMIGAVRDKLGGLTKMIPDWKGPASKDRRLLRNAGRLIIKGLIDGFDDGKDGVKDTLGKLTDRIEKYFGKKFKKDAVAKAHARAALKSLKDEYAALLKNGKAQDALTKKLEKARDRLKELKQASKDYAKQVAAAAVDYTNVTGLGVAFNSDAMLAELQHRLEKIKRFAALIKQLVAQGLNQTMIDQLVQAGVEGGLATAQAIADGGPEAIQQFNALQQQINDAASGLGQTAADNMYAAGIAAAEGLVKGLESQRKKLLKWAKQLAKDLIDAVKKALGINSPSRVFAEIGRNTVAGLTLGLDGSDVRATGAALASSLQQGFGSPELAAYADSSTSGGGAVYHITVKADATTDKVALGRALTEAINAYENAGGRRAA